MKHGIEVIHNSDCEVTREGDPDDKWDHDDTKTYWYLEGLKCESGGTDLFTDFLPEKGKEYFLVYSISGDGDSFGRSESCNINFYDLFHTYEEAEKFKNTLQEFVGKDEYNYKMWKYGDKEYYLGDLFDYFGGLETIEIEKFVMQ